MTTHDNEYLTVEEVARKLRVKKITVYRMARKGKLPAVKIGKAWRINRRKLMKLLEE